MKTSDDLEVYELTNLSKERLEEICDLRQPIQFPFDSTRFSNLTRENILKNYSSFDIKLRDVSLDNLQSEPYLPVTLDKGLIVLTDDKNKKFMSENNQDFLEETSLIKTLKANDEFLRPNMTSSINYDYIMGSNDTTTPLRYDNNYRNYFMVIKGSVQIKLAPPKSSKYLHPINDYDNYEFRSPINVWNTQDEYKHDFNKIKCMDITLQPGKILFIPAYWWYSLKFDSSDSSLITFKYRTYMNTVAILPSLFISLLQKQNIKHNVVKNFVSDKI